MTPPSIDALRALAALSVADAAAAAEVAIAESGQDPEVVYLLAELRARAGRALDALDLIDIAQRCFREIGEEWKAERCEVGRITVLDDLGRHEEALLAATGQVLRLVELPSTSVRNDLLVRARSNRGLCLLTAGRYAEALSEYDKALNEAALLRDPLLVAQLHINRSNVLEMLGRSQSALDDLVGASRVLEATGDREDQVKVATNIGAILCRRGEFDRGLEWLDRAERAVERDTDDEFGILVETGDALMGLGAIDEAARRYSAALERLSRSPMSWLEGRAWMGVGSAAALGGDYSEARRAFRSAHDSFEASDNHPWRVWALLELGRLDGADVGSQTMALEQARRALGLTDAAQWPVQAALAHLGLADLAHGDDKERHLREARRLAQRLDLPPITQRVEQRLGSYLIERGRPLEAAAHVRSAVAAAEAMRGSLHHFTLLRTFPLETFKAFDDLVEVCLAEGNVQDAWAATDAARSRSLLELGIRGGRRSRSPEAVAVEAELHGVYDQLMSLDEPLAAELRVQLDRRARELEADLDGLEFRLAPDESTASAEQPDAVGAARPDVTLLFRIRGGSIGVFVRTAEGIRWHPCIADEAEIALELDRLNADGRRAQALVAAGVELPPALHQASRARLAALGTALLEPFRLAVADLVANGHRSPADSEPVDLLIVAMGCLHGVPFHALIIDGADVVDLATVVVAPSLSVHEQCARRPRRTRPALLVAVSDGSIHGAAFEIDQIAAIIGDHDALREREATVDRVLLLADGAGLMHLATHGMFRAGAPLRSGVHLADGWLTAARAAELDLSGATVVLSACDTGRTLAAQGEELLGLQYGFLAAGARTVVVSLWPAHDESTVMLMADLYRRLYSGERISTALRAAQQTLRDSRPHVWWWAPFVVSGAA